MAMYDYVNTVAPDVSDTLSVTPQNVVTEEGSMNQVIHTGDDGSEFVVTLSSTRVFYVTLEWENLRGPTAGADAETIRGFYFDTAKGYGMMNSFKWTHPSDGYTYVVRFAQPVAMSERPASVYGIPSVRLRVLGRIAATP